jgi:putative ABC transport system permease protein
MRDLRFAVRLLTRSPGFAFIAILTLALGMGANTAFFSVLYGVVLAEPPYPDAARLVSIRHVRADTSVPDSRLSRAEVRDVRERARAFEGVAAAALGRATLTATGEGEGLAERVKVSEVTPNLFNVLGIRPIRGRTFLDTDGIAAGAETGGAQVAVISAGLWQSHFGGAADVLSRTIRLNGIAYAIVGVMPDHFAYPEADMAVWMPLDLTPRAASDRGNRYLFTVARLGAGIDATAASRDLARVATGLRHDIPDAYREPAWSLGLVSLRESQFGHMRLSLGVLQGAAALVLLIACVNVSIMSLLRAVGRRRELAIRFALGAGRSHVARQLLAEAAVLCGLGTLAGLAIASVAVSAVKAYAPADIPRLQEIALSLPAALFSAAVLVVITLIVGLTPIAVTRFRGIGGMPTSRVSDGRATTRLRDGLTVVEIALAAALVICAGLTLRSLHQLLTIDLGFATTHVVSFKTNLAAGAYPDAERVARFYDDLHARLQALPGARRVGAVSYLPLSGEGMSMAAAPFGGSSDAASLRVGWEIVRGRYFEAMGIGLLHGRLFDATDRATSVPVAIVDAGLARRWFGRETDAIGKRVRIAGGKDAQIHTIVGVVRDVSHTGPGKITLPTVYAPQSQVYQRGMYSVIETSTAPDAVLRAARAALASVDPSVPMYFAASVETRYDDALALPRFTAGLVSAFSTLALVLAGVGIFGVTAYAVSQRTREFGIRLALGAQRTHVGAIVLRRVGTLAVSGIAIGSALGFGLGTLMSGLLFGVSPDDPATFWAALATIGLTALAATVAPLYQAVRVNPAVILKAE